MKNTLALLAMVWLVVPRVEADTQWAYPKFDPKHPPQEMDLNTPINLPGSPKSYTQLEIDDDLNPPDWFPDDHPAAPEIVFHAKDPVKACAACHMASGMGHPQTGHIVGLPVEYFVAQIKNFASGARKDSSGWMNKFSAAISDEEARAAAEFFGSMEPVEGWFKVVETETVERSFIGESRLRVRYTDGGTEPLGQRIVMLPQDEDGAIYKDPYSGFIAYVPVGSLARGEELVTTGAEGTTLACNLCHGPDLRGLANVPRIRAAEPLYTVRALFDFQSGARGGVLSPLMAPAVDKLNEDDIIAIAAYLASLDP